MDLKRGVNLIITVKMNTNFGLIGLEILAMSGNIIDFDVVVTVWKTIKSLSDAVFLLIFFDIIENYVNYRICVKQQLFVLRLKVRLRKQLQI